MVRVVTEGWDSVVLLLPRGWVLRVARDRWAAEGYAVERVLLSRLAPRLPARVPVPVRSGRRWSLARRIDGRPVDARADGTIGAEIGAFLRALHGFPVTDARALGVPDERREANVDNFRRLVVPLLDGDERPAAGRLLDEYSGASYEPAVAHADLGPAHILVVNGRLNGVIDWTDTCIADRAIDLAWPLHGSSPEFAAGVADAYGVDAELERRALVYHALGPWHEVVHGRRRGADWVESGLAGLRARLPRAAEAADTMRE
jgi:aminoglycoside phosphotransferase (APT) family kinase protein